MIAALTLTVGLLALLAVPVEIAFAVRRRVEFGGSATMRWLFGLVEIPLAADPASKKRKPARKKRTSESLRTRRGLTRDGLTVIRSAAFQTRVLRFVDSVVRSFRISDLDAWVRFGFDDPADTGMVWGVVSPVFALVNRRRQANVSIQPSFPDACFEGEAHGRVRLIPLRLAWVLLLFALSPVVVGAVWVLVFGARR